MSFVYITEEGSRISKHAGTFVVSRNRETLFSVPAEGIEGVVLIDSVQVSSQAIVEFLQRGIPVTWISTTGKFFGKLESTRHVQVFKQRQQMLMQDNAFSLAIGKRTVKAKVHNQITLLRRYNRRIENPDIYKDIRNIMTLEQNIEKAEDKEQLRGYEGICAKLYFSALGKLVPQEFNFEKRSKRPPLDPFNSMLSLGYTLVMYELYTAISNQGLHPYFGFFHSLRNNHPALASDLLEEWRPVLIDSLVLSLIHHREIVSEHFYHWEKSDGIFLNPEGRKIFLQAYEKKMRTMNQYITGKHSYRRSLDYQVEQYSQALMQENSSLYEPIWIR